MKCKGTRRELAPGGKILEAHLSIFPTSESDEGDRKGRLFQILIGLQKLQIRAHHRQKKLDELAISEHLRRGSPETLQFL
jgi:hypothetical protein